MRNERRMSGSGRGDERPAAERWRGARRLLSPPDGRPPEDDDACRPDEFIRRFLIHVLPDGFHRIRYYGFLGNCHRARKLDLCRELLRMAPVAPADPPADYRDRYEALTGRTLRQCPHCLTGIMVVVGCIGRPGICQPVPDTS